jgi:trans-aconitate methyltransferase
MTWRAEEYDRRFSFVTRYGSALLELLDPKPVERILDVGCGTGHLTAQIAATGALVEGIDADPAMLARCRSEHPELSVRHADVRAFTAHSPFDAVLSNATLHGIPESDQPVALARIRAAMRAGGRFVAEMGGTGNVEAVVGAVDQVRAQYALGAAPVPWYFPGTGEQAGRLERAGFRIRVIEHYDRPTPLRPGDTLADWIGVFGAGLLADVPAAGLETFLADVDAAAAGALRTDDGWHVDYVRLRWLVAAADHAEG